MEESGDLVDIVYGGKYKDTHVDLNTSITDFAEMRKWRGYTDRKYAMPAGLYYNLRLVGKYVNTIGDLKNLAENADGFARLKHGGIQFNDDKELPRSAMRGFGKKKLDDLNRVLAEYGIDPIPWMGRKYSPGERIKERGVDWFRKLET